MIKDFLPPTQAEECRILQKSYGIWRLNCDLLTPTIS